MAASSPPPPPAALIASVPTSEQCRVRLGQFTGWEVWIIGAAAAGGDELGRSAGEQV